MSNGREHRLSAGRVAVFAAVVLIGFFVAANFGIELLERAGFVETSHPADRVQYVEERLFARGSDGNWHTTTYAEETLVRQSFPVRKGRAKRVFVLGGSFAMGSPYLLQDYPRLSGGIPWFLEQGLKAASPDLPIEVINAAAGAQNSSRVRAIAEQVLDLDPDLLVVATCNNEGELRPSEMTRWLNQQGGYRLLKRWLRPEAKGSYFTPQHPDLTRLRESYRANLRDVLAQAAAHDVPVVMATLPVNLRYQGWDTGGHIVGEDVPAKPKPEFAAARQLPVPEGYEHQPRCVAGTLLFEAGAYEEALPLLWECIRTDETHGRLDGAVPAYAAIAELELGRADEVTAEALRLSVGECLAGAIEHHYARRYPEALAALERCADPAEVLRWRGFVHLAQGATAPAVQELEQALEVAPRNRCRPTFNDIIREEAKRANNAVLVDLDRLSRADAPQGVPGTEVFVDYCHMNWRGYAAMAQHVGPVAGAALGMPFLLDEPAALAEAAGLPMGDNAEQVRVTNRWHGGGNELPPRPIP